MSNILAWLLETDNPPVQYLTLTQLLGRPPSDPEVKESKSRIMDYRIIREILSHFEEYIHASDKAYWKYRGKYWQLIFLAQLQADGHHPSVQRLVEDILQTRKWVTLMGMQCLSANILRAMVMLGYGERHEVRSEIEKLAQRIVDDHGIQCTGMDYSLLPRCYMALPKVLLCFGQLPEQHQTPTTKKAVSIIVDEILANHVYRYVPSHRKHWEELLAHAPHRSDLPPGQTVKDWINREKASFLATEGPGEKAAKPGWLKFGFPLHYNSDILEALYALTQVGTPMHPALNDALQVVENKMRPPGYWRLDNSLNGKMWSDVEMKGQPSKWVTYFACYVLQYFGRLELTMSNTPALNGSA